MCWNAKSNDGFRQYRLLTTKESQMDSLLTLLTEVRDNKRFWPDEATFRMAHQILPVPATEVAVVKDRKLLLQYRTFEEWPEPYNKPNWYIPGGYIPWGMNLHDTCSIHLLKDVRGEYKRQGVDGGDLNTIKLASPIVIGQKKWMPGEHPFGCPVSHLCVCELLEGTIVETEWLKWVDKPIPTDVPHHFKFQEMIFAWLNSTPEQHKWLKELHAISD